MTKEMIHWLDAHTHLDSDELYSNKDDLLDRAWESGVTRMVLVNSQATQQSFQRTIECLRIPHEIQRFACFGIHPHNASQYNEELQSLLMRYLKEAGIIAFGEIGLDYYYNFSPREVQVEVLKKQLDLADSLALPVVIHCREAYLELVSILKMKKGTWKGMIHCFTGTPEEAQVLLDLGFYISFSGIVTFKNASVLREAAKLVPLDRMFVETDAPYLAPVPYRGKTNEPAYVIHTGNFLAELKSVPASEFANQILENFERLFL